MQANRPGRVRRATCATAAAFAVSAAVLAPAAGAQETGGASSSAPSAPASGPDLQVKATVPGGPYVVGEQVRLTVTITNAGDAAATDVRGDVQHDGQLGSYFFVPESEWEELGPHGPGGTIEAGQTRTVHLNGRLGDWDGGEPVITVSVQTPGETNPADNTAADLPLPTVAPGTTDTVGGVVYGDANGNRALDPGEELSGVTMSLSADRSLRTTTGDDGRFTFTSVPAGIYSLSTTGTVPGGWDVPGRWNLRVDGSGEHTGLALRGTRPASENLTASITFAKATYQPGDTARLTITLTNTGPHDVSGIKAFCNRSGEGPHLRGWDDTEHWGQLAPTGTGVTVAAGDTATFDVTGTVPAWAGDHGLVYVECDFGENGANPDGNTWAQAAATLPGATADTWGSVYHDRDGDHTADDGETVTGVTLTLVNVYTGEDVASAVARAGDGRADFTGVPAGRYRVDVSGPWRPAEASTVIPVVAGTDRYQGWSLRVVPAPEQPGPGGDGDENPGPAQGGGGSDAAGKGGSTGQATEDLASTGVDAVTLTVSAVLALLAGSAALLLARRRRATS
ncbi:CARDB domain-containing protein [Prauserella muralis]|uniref:Uncharacterized protein n=1 Tax=Prauserella muralis TaxID=588067 RepID=A0A2V4BB24_9PSEU|nr:CARDB domain-containing protein [Prauserella muralis]PXY32261.1 hypothetical protein BAY60_08235 [Prauserella muralis]TWE24070.1 putative repeat protein (TIGR01451 family) [Prauserella muralis]